VNGNDSLQVPMSNAAHGYPSGFRRDWLLGLILVVAVIATYSPVWHAGFIWDDDLLVTANPVIIGPLGLKEIWTTSAADICPLTLTTFWVEHALWGLAPLPYHLVNVLLHAACAVLLWRVLLGLRIPGAWLGSALWALHPLQVESVAWITEMKNTQSGLFYLLTILFFVRWRKELELWPNFALRRAGDGQQIVHGDSARGAVLVCLVDRWSEAVAQLVEACSRLPDVDCRLHPLNVDAGAPSGGDQRFPLGAELATAHCNGG